jgi:vacuolar iron transporter family protein
MMKGVPGRITEWARPHVPEASDGILTSAGICEGFAGAGVGTKVLDELTQLYVSRGLSRRLARQVAIELTAHDALAAHAEAEHGITPASMASPLRDALAVGAAFMAGAVLPWLAIILIPGPPRAGVTFVIVLLALALTGWISAQISDVHAVRPIVRTAAIGVLAMAITYAAGHLFHP